MGVGVTFHSRLQDEVILLSVASMRGVTKIVKDKIPGIFDELQKNSFLVNGNRYNNCHCVRDIHCVYYLARQRIYCG